jgi:hypothetical protein
MGHIYAYWMGEKLFFTTQDAYTIFFFMISFKHQGERRRRKWIGSRENWLGYTKHGVKQGFEEFLKNLRVLFYFFVFFLPFDKEAIG